MKCIYGDDFCLQDTAVCLGKFDGIHLGHRLLLDYVVSRKDLTGVMFTFDMSPYTLFNSDFKAIYTNEEKISLLSKTGLDVLIAYPFTKETAAMEPEDFVYEVLVKKLNAKVICIGKDFRFGHNRAGDLTLLERLSSKYGFEVKAFDKAVYEDAEISSTRVRELIKEGDVKKAGILLGKPFFIEGEVVHGNGLGHTVDMPTANVVPAENKLLPKFGVYASDIIIGEKTYRGITNIGVKPSISDNEKAGAETMIFDFNEDIYGKTIRVNLLDFIRPERKMASLEEVKKQVEIDGEKARCL